MTTYKSYKPTGSKQHIKINTKPLHSDKTYRMVGRGEKISKTIKRK
jgi:hypothetical protein